ncbi:hypothetical protein F5Y01DRAFT_283004 [Xylaria sp. FL0043]|nr:hypothetical protein F5Y01DRAFT_283004 [Xylaria sp. FL0043]
MAKSYYGVRIGRNPGVYTNWAECKAQVEKCRNQYRGFDTYDEAAFYVATGRTCDELNGRELFDDWKRNQPATISVNNLKQEATPQIKTEAFDSSQSFFSQVPNFQPNNGADFDEEFGRFASSQNIAPGTRAWRQKRTKVIHHEVVFHYSQEDDSDDEDEFKRESDDDIGLTEYEKRYRWRLRIYQNICREAKLEPLDTIEGCITNIKGVLINIVDYIDAKRTGSPIKVWPPHQFEEFRRYTLSDAKRIDLATARDGDGFLASLLQELRRKDAAKKYQEKRDRAGLVRQHCASRRLDTRTDEGTRPHLPLSVIKEEPSTVCEVISIHDTDSEYSSPSTPIKEEADHIPPWSPDSVGSSVIEILISSQTGTKRDLHDFTEEQDVLQNGAALTSVHKRPRL